MQDSNRDSYTPELDKTNPRDFELVDTPTKQNSCVSPSDTSQIHLQPTTQISSEENLTEEEKNHSGHLKQRNFPFIIDLERLCIFTDGIIAIVITLLFVDVKFPTNDSTTNPQFSQEEYNAANMEATVVLAYAAAVVAALMSFWLRHCQIVASLRHIDSFFSAVNVIFILFCSFVPFSAKILFTWSRPFTGSLILFMNLFFMGLCLIIMWVYASRGRHLIHRSESIMPKEDIVLLLIDQILPTALPLILIGFSKIYWKSVGYALFVVPAIDLLSSMRLDPMLYVVKLVENIYNSIQRRRHMKRMQQEDVPEQNVDIKISSISKKERLRFDHSEHYFKHLINRTKFFGDAIFSIVITILILRMNPPAMPAYLQNSAVSNADNSSIVILLNADSTFDFMGMYQQSVNISNGNSTSNSTLCTTRDCADTVLQELLKGQWPVYVAFVITVVLVGSIWKHHVSALQGLKKANRLVLILDITMFGVCCVIPPTTAALADSNITGGRGFITSLFICLWLLTNLYILCHFSHLSTKIRLKWRLFELFHLLVILFFSSISLIVVWSTTLIDIYIPDTAQLDQLRLHGLYGAVGVTIAIPILEVLHATYYADPLLWIWKLAFFIIIKIKPDIKEDSQEQKK
jgi:uncharacterized membrane protein